MMDKFMDRLLESAASAYAPRLEEKKARVRTNPDQVEAWFDKEIEKLGNMEVKEIMKNATAGI